MKEIFDKVEEQAEKRAKWIKEMEEKNEEWRL